MLASHSPKYRRFDVAQRLIPFHCAKPSRRIPDNRLLSGVAKKRNKILGALLEIVGEVADRIKVGGAPPLDFRMNEFSAFGWYAASTGLVGVSAAEWPELLKRLEHDQASFTGDTDSIVEAIDKCLDAQHRITAANEKTLTEGFVGPMTMSQLYDLCKSVDQHCTTTFSSFVQRFALLKDAIESQLDATVVYEEQRSRKRLITITRNLYL